MKLGLFGYPVVHSRSPRIFSRLAALLCRPISYETVAVPLGALAVAVAERGDWRGANVTAPLKAETLSLCRRLTLAAREIGAANVLRFGRTIDGHNTDGEGLRDALRLAGVRVRGRSVLVFGAGGAARAAGWALAKDGASRVRFMVRTRSRAEHAARDLGRLFPETDFTVGGPVPADVWLNATPLGMPGFPDRTPAPRSAPPPKAAVDLVYGRRTRFQRDALMRGARVIDGTAMLVFQAVRAWEYWDGPLGVARRSVLVERLMEEVGP